MIHYSLIKLIPIALLLSGSIACSPQLDRLSSAAPAFKPIAAAPSPSATTGNAPSTQSRLSNQSQLTLSSIGNVQLGMTLAEATQAAGVPLNWWVEADPKSSCRYAGPKDELKGLSFMLNGSSRNSARIVRIDVTGKSPITSSSGAKIGDTEARIKSLYPGQIQVTPHQYVPNGHYLTFVPKEPQDQKNCLIFETDGRRVTGFHAGKLPDVDRVEGCL